jgi:hypothetical protein
MAYLQPTYHSKLYRDFKSIDSASYRDIIHFFERKEEDIRQLDFEEYFELLYIYVNALFEVGAYQKHVVMADEVIEAAICHNIQWYKNEDIFQKSLFRKAASLYNTSEFGHAEYILRELIRIDPEYRDAVAFLKKCIRAGNLRSLQVFRAAGIFLFLVSAAVICAEVLLVRPFYALHAPAVELLRNALFAGGCSALIAGELWRRWKAHRTAEFFVAENRQQKKRSGV